MNKHFLISILVALIVQLSFSQSLKKQTLGIQGSSHFVYANNKSYFIQESIGQASVINTYETNNYILRQGYLQPVSPSGIGNQINSTLDATIFPNPFVDIINIRFNEPVVDIIDVKLYDILGRVVVDKIHDPEDVIRIDLDALASGSYILRVKMRSEVLTANLIRR